MRFIVPSSYNEEDLKKISFLYWQKEKDERPSRYFDFTNPEHVGGLIEFYDSLDGPLIDTFEYYRNIAKLSDAQREILDMKIQKKNKNAHNQHAAVVIVRGRRVFGYDDFLGRKVAIKES